MSEVLLTHYESKFKRVLLWAGFLLDRILTTMSGPSSLRLFSIYQFCV